MQHSLESRGKAGSMRFAGALIASSCRRQSANKAGPGFRKACQNGQVSVFNLYADSYGLYVANRTDKGFEVREQQGGKSKLQTTENTSFQY